MGRKFFMEHHPQFAPFEAGGAVTPNVIDIALDVTVVHIRRAVELERCAGAQFDPELVPVFLNKLDEHREKMIAEGEDIPR